eukprot:105604-Chlamydomonas_euryale.AAC.7
MGSGTYCESASKIPIETSFRGTCLRTRRADNAPRHPHSATPESGMQVCGTAFHKSPPAGLLLCSWADYAPDNVGADHRKDGRPAGYDLPSPFASTHEVELSARASVRCLSCTFAPWPVYHTYDAPHVSGYVSSDVKLSAALPCSNFQKRQSLCRVITHCCARVIKWCRDQTRRLRFGLGGGSTPPVVTWLASCTASAMPSSSPLLSSLSARRSARTSSGKVCAAARCPELRVRPCCTPPLLGTCCASCSRACSDFCCPRVVRCTRIGCGDGTAAGLPLLPSPEWVWCSVGAPPASPAAALAGMRATHAPRWLLRACSSASSSLLVLAASASSEAALLPSASCRWVGQLPVASSRLGASAPGVLPAPRAPSALTSPANEILRGRTCAGVGAAARAPLSAALAAPLARVARSFSAARPAISASSSAANTAASSCASLPTKWPRPHAANAKRAGGSASAYLSPDREMCSSSSRWMLWPAYMCEMRLLRSEKCCRASAASASALFSSLSLACNAGGSSTSVKASFSAPMYTSAKTDLRLVRSSRSTSQILVLTSWPCETMRDARCAASQRRWRWLSARGAASCRAKRDTTCSWTDTLCAHASSSACLPCDGCLLSAGLPSSSISLLQPSSSLLASCSSAQSI